MRYHALAGMIVAGWVAGMIVVFLGAVAGLTR